MLKKILSVTGKPGLFKIINHSPKSLIVEEITNKKRMPISSRDRVVSLGDIAIYTTEDDKPLGEVFELAYAAENGQPVDIKNLISENKLRDAFAKILPSYDEERVRESDIKKFFTWYNLLLGAGITEFIEKEEEKTSESASSQAPEASSEKENPKPEEKK